MNKITIEEVKDIFKNSIDETTNINNALESTLQHIYLKGWNDALNEIKEEISNYIVHSPYFNTTRECCGVRDDVRQIIDKHIEKIEEEEDA